MCSLTKKSIEFLIVLIGVSTPLSMVVVFLYFSLDLFLVAMPVWYFSLFLLIYLGLRIGWLPTTIEKPTELQRIRELLEKIECEIKDCRTILRGEAPLD